MDSTAKQLNLWGGWNYDGYPKSPLQYPGSKTRAIHQIAEYIPRGIPELLSPFFGGGALELFLAFNGIQIHGMDNSAPLVNFWNRLIGHRRQLIKHIESLHPVGYDKFHALRRGYKTLREPLTQAAHFWAINRMAFGGKTFYGEYNKRPQWFLTGLKRLREINLSNIQVSLSKFPLSFESYKRIFAYVDPPYLIKSSYLYKGHHSFDHAGLAEILRERDGWILSYNDCEEIRRLYSGYRIVTVQWRYSLSNTKKAKPELLIIND